MPFIPLESIEQKSARRGFIPLADIEQPDQPENGALKTLRAIGEVYPVLETGANLVTQGVALPVAGLAGLGALATNAMGLTEADPGNVVHAVGGALTYQPRTDLGQHLTRAAMYPFEKLAEAGQVAGNATLESTGSPAAATVVDTAINALPMAIAPAWKGAKAAREKFSNRSESNAEKTAAGPATPEAVAAAEAGRQSEVAASRQGGDPGNAPARRGFIPLEEVSDASPAKPVPPRTERLAGDDQAMLGAESEGLDAVRRSGDNGVPGVDGELRPVPGGHGAGAEPIPLAGAAERAGELRTRELPVDDPATTGAAADLLQEGGAARPGHDSSRSGEATGTTETGHGVAPASGRAAPGEPPGGEAVPGLEVVDAQRRDPALAGVGEADRPTIGNAMAEGETRPAAGESTDAATLPQPKGARYALIEADSLKPSHDTELRPTPDYPDNLVRPAWSRADAETRVQSITAAYEPARLLESHDDATGAPIVGKDGVVEAGNARAIAMKRVYQANGVKAEAYRQQLREAAPRLGLEPAALEGMKKPVLVRIPDEPAPRHAAETQDMAAGTLNASWAPGASYVPFVDAVKQPVSKAAGVADLPDPIRRENIMKDFAQAIGTTVYQGRVKGKHRLGFFRPRTEEVRIKNANDIEVAAHEVAHLIDSRVPAIANVWRSDKEIRAQLQSVSYDQSSVKEGFAEAMRLYLTQPDALQAKAPKVFTWLDGFTRTHEYGPALKKAQADMTAWFNQDALNRARSKIGTEKPLSEFFDGFWDRFRQATVDDLHGVMKFERDLTGKLSPNGPYESARLSRASASIADGAVRYGHPVKKPDGSFTFQGKGLEDILKPVSENLEDTLLYFVGRSARELQVQQREHLFTIAETDAMLKLATPERKKAFEEYQAWNKGILDFAEAQGVVNGQARAMWQRTQYMPFHRVGQPGEFKGGKPGDWSGVKGLTGGTENLRDILSNMVQNAANLIDKAVKNEARVKVADLADKAKGGRFMVKIPADSRPVKVDPRTAADAVLKAMGIDRAEWRARGQKLPKWAERIVKELEEAPDFMEFMIGNQPPAGSNVVAVLRNGKPDWYEVGDPLLYRALSNIDRSYQHWLINWLGLPKRVGQATITLTPDFWMANLARDTIMGSVMSRSGFKPVIDSLQGMRLRLTNDPIYREYIANGGGLSSIYLDEQKLRAKLERFYTKQGIDYRTVLDTPDKLLGFIETLGDAFEMSTRLGEFKKAIAAGEPPRHAAYKGREVSTDFAMRGDSQALGMMYDTVMFLKPAVLSWDRLARGLAHDPNRGGIAIKAGALAMASAGLYLLNRGDPRYQDLPEWDRDANWHFFVGDQHFRYPKIWEIGALASAAERTVERTLDENPEGLGKDFARILGATFNVNLMPQIMAPLYQQATNRNSFTGSPIETPGMENMQPFLRSKPGTSETMKALGMATADMPEALQVNPARAEALVRGYFNTWAMYGLMLSDSAFFGDQLPEKRADELPVVRRFYAQDPARHTKYEEQFYDLLEESKRLRGTLRELDRIGRSDLADEKEASPMAGEAKPLERAAQNLQEINAEMRQVRRDETLTPAQKRERLDALTIDRNGLMKRAVLDAKGSIEAKEQ